MSTLCRLFVYGTLKPGERAYDDFCQPFAIATHPAQAQGRLYHLPLGYPAMTSEPGWVTGVVITFASEAPLQAIDAFEEYFPDRPQGSVYQRQRQPIFGIDQQPLGEQAWVYTMTREQVLKLNGQWLANGCWSETQSYLPTSGL